MYDPLPGPRELLLRRLYLRKLTLSLCSSSGLTGGLTLLLQYRTRNSKPRMMRLPENTMPDTLSRTSYLLQLEIDTALLAATIIYPF